MNELDMKNIIVLKDLPSNIIDEAIVILKDNKIKRKDNNCDAPILYTNMNVAEEAKKVIAEYIERIETSNREKKSEQILLIKYKKLQRFTVLLTTMMIIGFLIHFLSQ